MKIIKDVFGAHEEHHSHCREQNQREIFANMIREIGIDREQDREDREREDRDFDELRQRIHDEHSGECIRVLVRKSSSKHSRPEQPRHAIIPAIINRKRGQSRGRATKSTQPEPPAP